jgi:tight adherence protein B
MSPPAVSAPWIPIVLDCLFVIAAFVLIGRALASSRSDGLAAFLGVRSEGFVGMAGPLRRSGRVARMLDGLKRSAVRWCLTALALSWIGLRVAGPGGALVGAAIGGGLPLLIAARSRRHRTELMERQLEEVANSMAMAVRSGLSIRQAIEFAARETAEPMRGSITEMLRANHFGLPLDETIQRWADGLANDEVALLALVLSIHSRSGGDLAGALDEVCTTIRHRMAVRRELKALSAQGRISGAILGSLPIVFFVVLSASSRSELAPVYRSPAGIAMVSTGLVLQGLAYLWIRRLLRVEA